MRRLGLLPLPLFAAVLLGMHAPAAPPRIATLPIPGPARFATLARDVVDIVVSLDPSLAAGSGLFADSVRTPSYAPENVTRLAARLDHDLAALRRLPWRRWDVDTQIDFRWIFATAETARRQLLTERLYEHRPAQWLEPVANDLIALASYAPDRPELQDAVLAQVPAMVAEMRTVAVRPTRRDVDTARKLADALAGMAETRGVKAAAEALTAYSAALATATPREEHVVIGADSYAWRLRHTLLAPWSPAELLVRAQASLADVDARLATLPPRPPPPAPTAAQLDEAHALTREGLLALYDGVESANRAATVKGGWVSIPDGVGPIHARETPDAMVPLTGDGGSMNPPPTYATSNIGYWNVEHFRPEWTEDERVETVIDAEGFLTNGMGPYAAHEGFPGHHLQLAIARLNPNPLRSILPDPAQNEGWGLYAEEALYEHGGLGTSQDSERSYLGSYRGRIRRVVYDVNIETGAWDLQQAADFKGQAAPGKGHVDEDILRSINWPTQLICYYVGKSQIVQLRDDYRAKMGASYDERAFHNAFLAEGSIPVALIRAKLLGEPVPDLPEP
jgi:hypothetical protein